MARKGRSLKFPPATSVAAADVTAVLTKLRRFYDIGRASLKKYSRHFPPGAATKEGQEYGLNPELLRKARVFADPERGYTPGELNELCRQCERGGYALGHVHIISLLPVPKEKRKAYQRQAIKWRWSCRKLVAQIRRDNPKRESPGRKPSKIADATDALVRVSKMCRSWRGFYEQLVEPPSGEADAATQPVIEALPESLKHALAKTNGQMKRLDAAARDELDRAQRKSPKRKR